MRCLRSSAVLVFCMLSYACAGPSYAPPVQEKELLSGWWTFGQSLEGRNLRARTVGRGPRRVLWIGGIHGNEREGAVTTVALPAAFLERQLGERVTLTLVEDVNPDGSAYGVRHNRNRVDLNRNYPSSTFRPSAVHGRRPLDQPESRALYDLVFATRPDLVIVAHSWSGRCFINYDGPARSLAETFSRLSGYPIEVSENIHGTPGSLGAFLGTDLQIPILTLEHLHGIDPGDAWERTREALLAVIAGEEVLPVGADSTYPL